MGLCAGLEQQPCHAFKTRAAARFVRWRAIRGGKVLPPVSARGGLRTALRVVDDNFGFNKLLGMGRQKFALRLLASRGELPRLVAWYGR